MKIKPIIPTVEQASSDHYRKIKPKQSCLSPIKTYSEIGQLWRIRTVVNEIGISRTEVYRKIAAGNFPAPIKLGAKAVAWSSLAVQAWIQSKIEGSVQ